MSLDGGKSWTLSKNTVDDENHRVVGIDPNNNDIIYSVYNRGFSSFKDRVLYKSNDRGIHWSNIQPSGFYYSTHSFIIHPVNTNLLYGKFYDEKTFTNRWLRSQDGGLNWEPLAISEDGAEGGALFINPVEGKKLFLITSFYNNGNSRRGNHKLLSSTNFGKSWEPIGSVHSNRLVIDSQSEEHLLLFSGQSVSSSQNAGRDWHDITSEFDSELSGSLAIAQDDTNVMYFSHFDQIFKSMTGGEQWEQLPALKNKMYCGLTINPINNEEVLCHSREGSLYQSTDAGKTWNSLNLKARRHKRVVYANDGKTGQSGLNSTNDFE